jgi:hypothetical protein
VGILSGLLTIAVDACAVACDSIGATMANDPLALSAKLTELPSEADYDAVCAALMASERGRWFLAQFASRNRHAETDRLVAAIARIEALIRSDPPPDPGSDLFEIVATIERIESEIGAGATPGTDSVVVLERIQDIAFVLHERSIETTLCDALDAAIREISDICARSGAAAKRLHQAAARLRAVAYRLSAMLAPTAADAPAHPAIAEGAAAQSFEATHAAMMEDEAPAADLLDYAVSRVASLFELDAVQAEDLNRAIAALVGSLPPPADAASPPSHPPGEPAGQTPSDSVASDAPPREAALGRAPSLQGLSDSGITDERALSAMPESLMDPQEDPAELFENVVGAGPDAAGDRPPSLPNSAEIGASSRAAAVPRSPTDAAGAAMHSIAAIRALSEEELIALFS